MHTAHRIIAAVVSAPILLIPAAALANADAPPGKGANGGAETNDTGKPVNPNGFGAVVSQLATGLGGIGSHTSRFAPGQQEDKPAHGGATGRLGVGNVSRNDGGVGSRPGDHASVIDGGADGIPVVTDAFGHPGRQR